MADLSTIFATCDSMTRAEVLDALLTRMAELVGHVQSSEIPSECSDEINELREIGYQLPLAGGAARPERER